MSECCASGIDWVRGCDSCSHWWQHTSYGHGRRETECVVCGAVLRNGHWVRVNRWAEALERAEEAK